MEILYFQAYTFDFTTWGEGGALCDFIGGWEAAFSCDLQYSSLFSLKD